MDKFNNIKTNELASTLSMSSSYVSQIKSGTRPLKPVDALLITKKYNIPLWELRPDVYPKELFEVKDEK